MSAVIGTGVVKIEFGGCRSEHGVQKLSPPCKGQAVLYMPGPQELMLQGPKNLRRSNNTLSPGTNEDIVRILNVIFE